MRRPIGRMALWGLVLQAVPGVLAAQEGGRVWGGMGIGGAYASVECPACTPAGSDGGATGWETTVTASLGRSVGRRSRIGLEGAGWYRATRGDGRTLENATEGFVLSAAFRYRPIEDAGLHLRTGVGVGMTQRYGLVGDSLRWYDAGPSATVGVGYDLGIGRSWALVPYATATGMVTFSLRSNVEHSRRPGWINLGVALERH